jgi:hypothetical protein
MEPPLELSQRKEAAWHNQKHIVHDLIPDQKEKNAQDIFFKIFGPQRNNFIRQAFTMKLLHNYVTVFFFLALKYKSIFQTDATSVAGAV